MHPNKALRGLIRVALFALTLHALSLTTPAQTWSAQTSGTANNLLGIHFTSATDGWAVGVSNTIRRTTDGGMNWTTVSSPGTVPISSYLGVRFLDANTGWVGGGTVVMRTTNAGGSWSASVDVTPGDFINNLFATSLTQAWAPVARSGGRFFARYTAQGDGSIIAEVFDNLSGASSFFDIYFVDADNGWAVGGAGSLNPGQIRRITGASGNSVTFTSQTSGTANGTNLNGIFMFDLNTGWIVGSSGTILKTTNGGTNWNPQTSGTTNELRSVHFKDANEGWAVGASGLILHTTDGGTGWAQEGSGVTTQLLRRVFSINPVYAAGLGGTILKRDEPTDATLISFQAVATSDGQISLDWQTGFEADNLGFHLYREQNGERVRITQQLIAGSALIAGSRTALTAGRTYTLRDRAGGKESRYWLEAIALNGQSVWHGPFSVTSSEPSIVGNSAENPKPIFAKTLPELDGAKDAPVKIMERVADSANVTSTSAGVNLASLPAVKIAIQHEGWYRLTQAELAAVGFDVHGDPRTLQMFVAGREIPIQVSTGKNGAFDNSSFIEFYGIGVDTPATASRIYWLMQGKQPGKRISQTKVESTSVAASSFSHTIERRDRSIYFAALRNGERENFFGSVVDRNGTELFLPARFLDRASEAVTLEVSLQGVTIMQHRVGIFLNASFLGDIAFNGQEQGTARLPISPSLLTEGVNQVTLISRQGESDVSLVDYLRLTYPHRYLSEDNRLLFTAKGQQRITIAGFTEKSIRVFDVTNADEPQEVISNVIGNRNGYAVTFAPPGEGEHRLLACTDSRIEHTTMVVANRPSHWRDTEFIADLVIITHQDWLDSFAQLARLREKQGLSVALVDVEDIYDEFNYGEKSPLAIRDFLRFTWQNWKRTPRFVLLAGQASFDPKDYRQRGNSDFVPTKLLDTEFLETASDDWFADFNDDSIAEMAVGRLPVSNAREAEAVIRKLVAYENMTSAQEAVLVADLNDGFPFTAVNEQLSKTIPESLRITQINRGQSDTETAKRQLQSALYREPMIVSYSGHGSTMLWRGNLLTIQDARNLTNTRLPVFVMMTCLNGYFHDADNESLAAALVKNDSGGAIAAWASSGLTSPTVQAAMNRRFFQSLFEAKPLLLGDLIQQAKAGVQNEDARRTWILIGDPTLRIK